MKENVLLKPANSFSGIVERLAAHSILAVIALLTAGPYIVMILISLMGLGWEQTAPPKLLPVQWSLTHYVGLFDEFKFITYFTNSLIYSGAITLVILVFDSFAGYAFARLKFRGRDVTFFAVVATMMISPMVLFIPTYLLFSRIGLVNTYLGVILAHVYSGFGVFLMRQFIQTMPSSLEDAALIDGCSKFGVYWRIVLPTMKPALATLGIVTFISAWRSFLWPLILTRDSNMYPLTVALTLFQNLTGTNWSSMMAAAALTLIPSVIVFVSMQQYYVRGFTMGGIKG